MSESILQKDKKCLVCGTRTGLHYHHIFGGNANRRISDKHGFTCWLCGNHHNLTDDGIHFNRELDTMVKKACQRKFEETHSRSEFMSLIGRNYLED